MIPVQNFYDVLVENGMNFFCGVPDSLLKDFCAYISAYGSANHMITANEGAAVAMAAGHYIATGKPAVVYMQNSGIGNAINPLLSLTDEEVYKIPVLLIIGWRGEPGVHDEPQHIKQGKVTLQLLEAVGIEYVVVDSEFSINQHIPYIMEKLKAGKQFALVVKKGSFEKFSLSKHESKPELPSREDAIITIVDNLPGNARTVATTGMISRELFEYRSNNNETHAKDFLTVGSMGHASQIALAIAWEKPEKKIFCLDGDGSVIMHMGSLCINGSRKLSNFYHIVFNNAAHDSVGGQPTAADKIQLTEIAEAAGYRWVKKAETVDSIVGCIKSMVDSKGPAFLEVAVRTGSRPDLGRPTITPQNNLKEYMKLL